MSKNEKEEEVIVYNDIHHVRQAFGNPIMSQGFLAGDMMFSLLLTDRFTDLRTLYHTGKRGDYDWGRSPMQKHPIVYVLVRTFENEMFVAYKRSSTGGENRLYNKWSIGFGGHIDQVDVVECFKEQNGKKSRPDLLVVSKFAAKRELIEELCINVDKIKSLNFMGFINDDSNSVGKDHYGIVYEATVDIAIRDITPGSEFDDAVLFDRNTPLDPKTIVANLEGWSKLIYPGFI